MLCFDGDSAGRRAAYRAVDLALPQLKPGKSLQFALLPEGQDPDDLVRSGGREAIEEVHRRSAPARRHAVDARDRSGALRHAGAARGAGSARQRGDRGIGDESVRKYYRQDFNARLAQFFAPRARNSGRTRRDELARAAWAAATTGREAAGTATGQRRDAPRTGGRASLMWWPARNWRRARSIAAIARRFRGARR